MTRKVIQLQTLAATFTQDAQLIVLCDDGTMWQNAINGDYDEWQQITNVPQYEEDDISYLRDE